MTNVPSQEKIITEASTSRLLCRALCWDGDSQSDVYRWWEQLYSRLPETPLYHHPEWTAVQCRAGAAGLWRVLVVMRDDEPLAVIPLRRRSIWLAEVLDDFNADVPPVLIDPAAEDAVWAAIAEWLYGQRGVKLLRLGRHSDPGRLQRFAESARDSGAIPRLQPVAPMVCIPLADSWEEHFNTLGANARRSIRQMEKHAAETGQIDYEMLTASPAADYLMDILIALHRCRWQQQASGSIFDHPRRAQCYRELFHWAIAQRAAAITTLRISGRQAATSNLFHTSGHSSLYCNYMAVDRDVPAPKRFSAGIFVCVMIIRWAIARGVKTIYIGFGSSDYKRVLGGTEVAQYELSIARSTLAETLLPKFDAACTHLCRLPRLLRHYWRRARGGAGKDDKCEERDEA